MSENFRITPQIPPAAARVAIAHFRHHKDGRVVAARGGRVGVGRDIEDALRRLEEAEARGWTRRELDAGHWDGTPDATDFYLGGG